MKYYSDKRARFKKQRRKWEFSLISEIVAKYYPPNGNTDHRPYILEFGSGPSGGAEFLAKIGDLVVSDIYEHNLLNLPENVEFCIADIHNTHFRDEQFDVLISNQVLEHLDHLDIAFREMMRITRRNGHFFFSVPTSFWLLLTIPGQVAKKFYNVTNKLFTKKNGLAKHSPAKTNDDPQSNTTRTNKSYLSKFFFEGHGCYPGFFECLSFFRIKNWRKTIITSGFEIIEEKPLLAYGSSNFPVIPTNSFLAKLGLASSYLFVCKQSN